MKTLDNKVRKISKKSRGYIIEAESEAEILRNEHIEKNRRQGRDTKITELL